MSQKAFPSEPFRDVLGGRPGFMKRVKATVAMRKQAMMGSGAVAALEEVRVPVLVAGRSLFFVLLVLPLNKLMGDRSGGSS